MSEKRIKISQEVLLKCLEAESAEELQAIAKQEGYAITLEQAEKYYAQGLALTEEQLERVAGGGESWCYHHKE